jgi:hypothetical protein
MTEARRTQENLTINALYEALGRRA